jgi:hypothetical protein
VKIRCCPADEWCRLCGETEYSSIYQDPRWLELIEQVYPRLRLHRLACVNAAGTVVWLLPLVAIRPIGKLRSMLISVPFGNYGGFLYRKSPSALSEEQLQVPLNEYFNETKAFALEIRETGNPLPGFMPGGDFARFELTLPDTVEKMWKGTITGNARTSVRKADKLGVHVSFHDARQLEIFQELNERHAAYHGTPIHKRSWYPTLVEKFGEQAEIIIGRVQDTPIGALMVLYHEGKAILHAAISDVSYRHIPVTDKLLWAYFEKAIESGKVTSFDFGRTRADSGKRFFKRKWGAIEKPLNFYYLMKPGHVVPRILPENPALAPAIVVWRHLPRWVHRSVGPLVRVRIPT